MMNISTYIQCIGIHVYICVCMYVCMYVCIYLCTCLCINTFVCMRVCVYTWKRPHSSSIASSMILAMVSCRWWMLVHVCIHILRHTHTRMSTHAHTHTWCCFLLVSMFSFCASNSSRMFAISSSSYGSSAGAHLHAWCAMSAIGHTECTLSSLTTQQSLCARTNIRVRAYMYTCIFVDTVRVCVCACVCACACACASVCVLCVRERTRTITQDTHTHTHHVTFKCIHTSRQILKASRRVPATLA
jgi:hypothetical protein